LPDEVVDTNEQENSVSTRVLRHQALGLDDVIVSIHAALASIRNPHVTSVARTLQGVLQEEWPRLRVIQVKALGRTPAKS